MVPGGQAFKRLAVPPTVPESLKHWYMLKEVYVSRTDASLQWVYDASLAEKVLKDFQSLAPMYRLLRGAYEATIEE